MTKTQQRLSECLSGSLPVEDLQPFERSALQIHIYFRSRAIMDLPPSERKAAGMAVPENIRALVRNECKRLLELRS